jgi:cation diffusion facilitator CzcD-associated flavoprotein CzcO
VTSADNEGRVRDAIIIGAGFAGLGMAVAFEREGLIDYLILERAGDVGGAWRDNTYPGAACDIQSHLYSYSFRPNPDWSRVFATQPEILAYLRRTAEEEGIRPHIRFGADVTSARWNSRDRCWDVTAAGSEYRARTLISAAGHLSDPVYPDIPGLQTFAGRLFHSARWDHEFELRGTRVGLIGTGASGIQIVPELADVVASLDVFQRSAPYIVPRRDREYTVAEKRMFARVPETAQNLRDELFWYNESRFPQRRQVPSFIEQISSVARDHLASQVPDPALRAQLTPDYEIGCKRILISNDYYPALQRPNVRLRTEGIARIDETGIVLGSGEHVDLDVIVAATGFEAVEPPISRVIVGRIGRSLAETWDAGMEGAYACTTVAGFPNFFIALGPNTGLGAGSMIYMAETQIGYVREAVAYILATGATVEPAESAQRRYVESVHRRSEGTVWTAGGCSSWYLHPRSGRLTTLWPDFMSQFRRENGHFSPSDYVSEPDAGELALQRS